MSQAMRKFIPLEWVEKEDDHWTVRSASDERQRYRVEEVSPGIWRCACPANAQWSQESMCKHILATLTKNALQAAVAYGKQRGDDEDAFDRFIEEVEKEWLRR